MLAANLSKARSVLEGEFNFEELKLKLEFRFGEILFSKLLYS